MDKLTRREREIVQLLIAGRRQREIAADLHIERSTVKMHLSNARMKTGARTTVELAARAAGEGE